MNNPMLKTMMSNWTEYRRAAVPRTAPVLQIQETRRAFFAGMHQAICSLQALSAQLPEDEAMDVLDAWMKEAEDFAKIVGTPAENLLP